MANNYDAIVIGGGHNGLVAAAYLAKYGKRVVVLEARHKTGGAADTSSPWPEAPEFKVMTLSYTMSLMPPYILNDLRLKDFGYKINPLGMGYTPHPDGRSLIEGEGQRSFDSFADYSKKDAEAMGPYYEWIGRIANLLHPLLNRTPPHLSSRSIKDIKDVGQLAWSLRKELDERTVADITRLFTMSAADLLERWFEDPTVIGSQSVNGIIGTWAGPMTPGTAYVLMHHSTGEESEGQVASWGMPEGGMGAVSDAIRASAESFGADIRVGTPVDKVLVKNGRAVGVATASGEEFRAPVVITACHPQITFLRQVDRADLPEEFVEDIERWRSRSGTVKINLALDRLPEFTADPGFDPDVHGGAITILDDLEYLETAFQEARAGKPATVPFADCEIPTVFDRTLAPEGKHVMSMFTQWVPESWSREPHREELEAYAERLFDRFELVAPGFKRLDPAPPDHRALRHGAGVRPDRRQHLPRRAHGRSAVPHASGRRVRGLPHADPRAVPGEQRDARGRRRDRSAGPPRRARDPARQGALAMGAVRSETRDGILELTIDRPPANAIDSATSRELGEVFVAFRDDPSLRVAVITGAGDRFFSAGWDLKAAAAGDPEDYGVGGFAGLTERFDLDKPVIAAVNGWAAGGGFELALACDLIVASRTARFVLPEVNLGFVPDAGGVLRLPARMPRAIAMELMLTGREMDAAEAARWGVVNRVTEPDGLLDAARELAARIAAAAPLGYASREGDRRGDRGSLGRGRLPRAERRLDPGLRPGARVGGREGGPAGVRGRP